MTRSRPGTEPCTEGSIAVYVHWPFCRSRCPYCDFNAHVRDTVDQARWRAALIAELEHYGQMTAGRVVTSLFFGGGTPSLMEPETVAALIARVGEIWRRTPDIEITLEANPTSAEARRFAAFAEAGVNRVSLGVQALDDAALGFLGRGHTSAEALAAVELARRTFPRVSFDLIYARPGQDVQAWMRELDRTLPHAGEHLSVYQLTIEPGTPFHALYRQGALTPPDEPTAAALFEATGRRLAAAGLMAYEISNHARPGAECRHNLSCWRYGDYVGVGPGAHGRLTQGAAKLATRQHRAPERWLRAVEGAGHGTAERVELSREARLSEMLLMGLRLVEGVPRDRFRRELGAEPEALIDPAALERLVEGGFLTLDEHRLGATDAGRQRLDSVLATLLTPARPN
ncbi:MAG: radical SAM family heme chaperone HemW [Kiloniellales bacterium]